jgi:hypothetical protein
LKAIVVGAVVRFMRSRIGLGAALEMEPFFTEDSTDSVMVDVE